MPSVNEYLATVPFDLYQLHLFHLVVKHRSFTRASQLAGLTQSAMTRQMQAMENHLGLDLLERTTRSVYVTPAGEFLFRESAKLLGDVDATLLGLRQQFGDVRKVVRVGVSTEVSLAYLPGFFHSNLRHQPEVRCQLSRQSTEGILSSLVGNELDLGVLAAPPKLPAGLEVTHRFRDAFTLITHKEISSQEVPFRPRNFAAWGAGQQWLLISEGTITGQKLRGWLAKKTWVFPAAMELDDFDLIINLVSLGMGVSFVPLRALALYGSKRTIRRVPLKERFERELVVVSRRRTKVPPHLTKFIENILF